MFADVHLASNYVTFRPQYDESFGVYLMDLVGKLSPEKDLNHGLAVDVGCGNGQLTSVLAPYYDKVVGVDESVAQIDQANQVNRFDNVKYFVCKAETLAFESSSVDLVSAAQCVHWFDAPRFYSEVRRILKPSGHLVVCFYKNAPELWYENEATSHRLTQAYKEAEEFFDHGGFMAPGPLMARHHRDEVFAAIPFENQSRDQSYTMEKMMTIPELVGYIESKSYYNTYVEKTKNSSFCERFQERLVEAAGGKFEGVAARARFNVDVVVARMS